MALKTAIYVRVSTEEQAQEGFSIRGQTEKLKSYALLKEWDIFDIYADEGISGKNIVERPAINRLILDIKEGNVNNVLVFKVDRLTRSTRNLIELVDIFDKYNCAFNSLTESIDTETPSGRMFLKIIGIFAEFERENLASRLKLGFERKVKEGYTLANYSLSYGYDKPKGQKIQTINIQEAQIVREIYEKYMNENLSMSKICKNLNERNVKTKRNAIIWDVNSLKLILTNPTYIGKVRYLGNNKDKYFETDGHHEPIISKDLFKLVQEKIEKMPKLSRTKRPKDENYFCGVLVCGRCGAKLTTHNCSQKINDTDVIISKTSYRCNNKKYLAAEKKCDLNDIRHDEMERVFSEYIDKIGSFDGVKTENLNEPKENNTNEIKAYIEDCENRIVTTERKKKTVIEQYLNDEISFEEYKEMLKVLGEKIEKLLKDVEKSRETLNEKSNVTEIAEQNIIKNLKENWQMLNNCERLAFMQNFVKKIVINVDKVGRFCVARIEKVEFC